MKGKDGNMSDASNQATNNTGPGVLLSAFAYLHLILIIVPTVILGMVIIVAICKKMKKKKKSFGLEPIIIFYLAMALSCVTAVLTYGLLWDISVITDIAFLGDCGTYPVYNIYSVIYFSFHSIVSLNVAAAAIFQFVVLIHGKKISSRWVYFSLLVLVIASVVVSCIWLNGRHSNKIRGSLCRFTKSLDGTIDFIAWLPLTFVVPLILTIVFSVLTCHKVKKSIAIASSKKAKNALVTSIVQINVFNIVLYTTFRLASILIYLVGSRLLQENENAATAIIMFSRNLNDASYPMTLVSILAVHKGMRRVALRLFCARLLDERGTDTHVTTTGLSGVTKPSIDFASQNVNDSVPN